VPPRKKSSGFHGAVEVVPFFGDDYFNQFLTWRELAINFVHFNLFYDSIESAPNWANKTLAAHASDRRPILYTREQFEFAQTHDQRGTPHCVRCCTPDGCTTTCACIGRRNSGVQES